MPEAQQAEPQSAPQPQVTTGTKPHDWKKVGLTVLIILVVAGLIVVAYWFLVLNKTSEVSDLTGPVPKPKVTASTPSATSAEKDETADWKIYSSKTHSIKYPEDWVLRECAGNVSFAPNNNLLGVCQSGDIGLVSTLQIDYVDYKKYLSQSDPSPYDNYLQQKTTVSGKEAIRTSGTYNGTVEGEGTRKGAQTIIYVVNFNDKGFMIKYFRYPEGKDYSNIFATMVSTFKILD